MGGEKSIKNEAKVKVGKIVARTAGVLCGCGGDECGMRERRHHWLSRVAARTKLTAIRDMPFHTVAKRGMHVLWQTSVMIGGMSKTHSLKKSESSYAEAQKLMPGGVSSPVRAFKAVGGTPPFIKEAEGCTITDIDGNQYVDYVGSYGPIIAGHANETVVAALSKAIGYGTSYGAPTCGEIELAKVVTSALPSVEMIRFVNSGTEAAMSAIRLARAATGRDLIVKCIGCYHGHVDGLLVEAGSGALTLGLN